MSKRALLVGINYFGVPIRPLQGCVQDTDTMKGLLTSFYGFAESEIKVLNNAEARTQAIKDGLAWLFNSYEDDGSDVRVFHFSSHGTQVEDQAEGDELEALDEVIVPYDHNWEQPFRDDDLRAIFDTIPDNVNFTFIADCCHSGSIQKALIDRELEFEARYVPPPPAIMKAIETRTKIRKEKAITRARTEMLSKLRETPEEQWDSMTENYLENLIKRYQENKFDMVAVDRHVLLAGCQDRQTAADARIEGTWQGAFTWALAKVVKEANGQISYETLITRAGTLLTDFSQLPQLECPDNQRHDTLFAPRVKP